MKVLVTGSAGFIGFHTVERLVTENFEVIGIDNINDYYDVKLKFGRLRQSGIDTDAVQYNKLLQSSKYANYKFIKLDIEDKEKIDELFENERFDFVVSLAAQAGVRYSLENPHAYVASNIGGFMTILEACRKNPVRHLIYASTSSVYGLNTKMPFSEKDSAQHPVSLYAATKKANEVMAHSYSHLFNIPSTGLRFFTVYGPWGRPDMALFKFTKAICDGKAIDVYNNGNMLRDFTFVSDIVQNIYLLLQKPPAADTLWDADNPDPSTSSAPHRILNIGNSNPVKLTEYIRAIEESLGKNAICNLLPMQPGDVLATFADIRKLEDITGFRPIVPVEEGVLKFVQWYVDFYKRETVEIVN